MNNIFKTGLGRVRRAFTRPLSPPVLMAIIATLLLLCLFLVFRIFAPFLVSSTLVRGSLEDAVARWTGHEVTISGVSQVSFWPEPRITLSGVTIRKEEAPGRRVLGRIQHLSAEFGLYNALLGKPDFHEFRFVRPEIFVIRDRNGRLNWTSDGILGAAVGQAETMGEQQTLRGDLDAEIGSVAISNGSLELFDQETEHSIRLGGIDGSLNWPQLSSELRARLSAMVGEQKLTLDLSSAQPLLLFAGKDAAVRANISSSFLKGSFNGIANMADHALASGALQIEVSDVAALRGPHEERFSGTEQLRSFSLRTQLTKNGDMLRFDQLALSMNETEATGVLDVNLPAQGKPRVTGTLAFDHVNIDAILAALSLANPSPEAARTETRQILQEAEFDLSLSAAEARLAPFMLTDVAASAVTSAGRARLDIRDSDFEGGRLTAELRSEEGGFDNGGSLQLSIRDANIARAAGRLGATGPLPSNTGSLDLVLQTKAPIRSAARADIYGKFRFTAENGTLPGFNVAHFRQLAGEKSFFHLEEVSDGTFNFDRLDFAASFDRGIAEIETARMTGQSLLVTLDGVIPYRSNSMALSGEMAPIRPDEAGAQAPVSFFVGGSWPDPIFWPVVRPIGPPAEQETTE